MAEVAESSYPSEAAPTIYEAERASGPSGAVLYGSEISFDVALTLRKSEKDVVVRGEDYREIRRLANKIESAVGPAERQNPHTRAGSLVLPHYQQINKPPEGHTFYETEKRKSRKRP
jgi:hypothetical protein